MTIRKLQGTLIIIAIAVTLIAGALPASAQTAECFSIELDYEVRPGPAQTIIGQAVLIDTTTVPAHLQGLEGSVHVEVTNGDSVHWNNFMSIDTNGSTSTITGTEDTAFGVRISDATVTLGTTVDTFYTIGTRDPRDVPGVEGASLVAVVTICATVPQVTTTTAPPTTTTTVPDGTTTTIPNGTTTTVPDTSTTTDPDTPPTTTPDNSTTTIPPVTPPSTLPFTGPPSTQVLLGLGMAAFALTLLGSGVLLAVKETN